MALSTPQNQRQFAPKSIEEALSRIFSASSFEIQFSTKPLNKKTDPIFELCVRVASDYEIGFEKGRCSIRFVQVDYGSGEELRVLFSSLFFRFQNFDLIGSGLCEDWERFLPGVWGKYISHYEQSHDYDAQFVNFLPRVWNAIQAESRGWKIHLPSSIYWDLVENDGYIDWSGVCSINCDLEDGVCDIYFCFSQERRQEDNRIQRDFDNGIKELCILAKISQ